MDSSRQEMKLSGPPLQLVLDALPRREQAALAATHKGKTRFAVNPLKAKEEDEFCAEQRGLALGDAACADASPAELDYFPVASPRCCRARETSMLAAAARRQRRARSPAPHCACVGQHGRRPQSRSRVWRFAPSARMAPTCLRG